MIFNFSGTSVHKIDSKNRVSIPAKFRRWSDEERCKFVISTASDPYLIVTPSVEWDRMLQKFNKKFSNTNKRHRAYVRAVVKDAELVKSDKQGRILIPQNLLDYAQISEKATIVGTVDTIEIWNPEIFKQEETANLKTDDEYFDGIEELLNS